MNLSINPVFERLLCPLSPIEYGHLEASILACGCREKIIVWAGENVIVDGHNRFKICTEHGVPFDVHEVDFESSAAVEDWIDRNQLGRRNLSPDDYKIVSGRIYNRRKKAAHGRRDREFWGPQIEDPKKTSAIVAEELGTSKATIERNGQRAEVYDRLVDAGEVQAAEQIKTATQAEVVAVKDLPVEKAAEVIKSKPQVVHNSGNNEWYTPPSFIEAARTAMGSIDTDPATCEVAQANVRAEVFFTEQTDGLKHEWHGNVWMNPPYGSSLIGAFASKLVQECDARRCTQAIVLVNNATETKWFQQLAESCSAICLPAGRIQFLDYTGKPKQSPVQGQCFLYFGDNVLAFIDVFSAFGVTLQTIVNGKGLK